MSESYEFTTIPSMFRARYHKDPQPTQPSVDSTITTVPEVSLIMGEETAVFTLATQRERDKIFVQKGNVDLAAYSC